MSERKINIDQSQASVGVGYSEKVEAKQIGGTINNYSPEQRQTLADAAKEIQELLDQLSQTYQQKRMSKNTQLLQKLWKKLNKSRMLRERYLKL